MASGLIYAISISIFFSFTKALRHFNKYIAVFEKEEESLYAEVSTIRPTTQIFHMKRDEIKDRFCVSKTLTFSVVIIFMILGYKYVIEVYRLLLSEHVSFQVEMGQSATDDLLVGTLFFFFTTLLYASLSFKADGSKGLNKYRGYCMRNGFKSMDYDQSLITPNEKNNRRSNRTYYTIEGENNNKNTQSY